MLSQNKYLLLNQNYETLTTIISLYCLLVCFPVDETSAEMERSAPNGIYLDPVGVRRKLF